MITRPSEAPRGTTASHQITRDELQLTARNHGMPLEALRYDITPLGLHYVLVHYDIPAVDEQTWRLHVDGRVGHHIQLSLADLRARPRIAQQVTMECAGTGRARLSPRTLSQPWLHEAIGNAEWTGTPLAPLLDEAGLLDDAVEIVFTGVDQGLEGDVDQVYQRSLPIGEVRREEVILAYEMNGQPLLPQHGFPLRLLVPGWYGMTSVKWLSRITAVSEPFEGYQQAWAYHYRQHQEDPGVPVERIAVRSLMIPPGIPDFFTRHRYVELGPCQLSGRAWSGNGPVVRVELSADGGSSWADASVSRAVGPHAWLAWAFTWHPPSTGDYELCCRATDAAGDTQPLRPVWNLGGYAVNAVQRVSVTVQESRPFEPPYEDGR